MSYCNWGNASSVTLAYHDAEWGLPVREDRRQFEYLMMEVM
jgi:DNA-3-methyladenine glycosylase I